MELMCPNCMKVFYSSSGLRRHRNSCESKEALPRYMPDILVVENQVIRVQRNENHDGIFVFNEDNEDGGGLDSIAWSENHGLEKELSGVDLKFQDFFKYDLQNIPATVKSKIIHETRDFIARNNNDSRTVENTFDSLQYSDSGRCKRDFESLGLSIEEVSFRKGFSGSNEKLYMIPIHKIFPFYLSLGSNKDNISKYSKLSVRLVEVNYSELSTSELLRSNLNFIRSQKGDSYPLLIYLDKVAIASQGRLFFDFQVGTIPAKYRQTIRHIVTFAGTSDACIVQNGIDLIASKVIDPILDIMSRESKEVRFLGVTYHLNIFPFAFLGDNDESQNLSGCKTNFNNFRRRISRYCFCPKEEFYDTIRPCTIRNIHSMQKLCSLIDMCSGVGDRIATQLKILWGIDHTPRSIFSIPNIQYPFCFPPDIAHDILEGMGAREVDSNILNQLKKKTITFEGFKTELTFLVKKYELGRFGKFNVRERILSFYDCEKRNPSERCQYSAGVAYLMFQMTLFVLLRLNPSIDLGDKLIRRYIVHRDVMMMAFSRNHNKDSIDQFHKKICELLSLSRGTYRFFMKLHNYKIYPKYLRLLGSLVDIMLLVHEIKNKILKNLYNGGPNVVKTILMESAIQLKKSYKYPKNEVEVGRGIAKDRNMVCEQLQDKFPDTRVFSCFRKVYIFNLPIQKGVLMESSDGIVCEVVDIFRSGFLDEESNELVFVCMSVEVGEISDLVPYKSVSRGTTEVQIVTYSSVKKVMYKEDLFFQGRVYDTIFLVFDKTDSLFVRSESESNVC